MSTEPGLHRTYLYASGTKPRSMARAIASDADAVILDLEDSVAPEDKTAARGAVADFIAARAADATCDVHVRVNRWADGFDIDDVRAVVQPGVTALRLPKVQSVDEVRSLDALVAELEAAADMASGTIGFYPTVETASGAMLLGPVLEAATRTRRAAFGASDFVADISASGNDDLATMHVRSHMVMVSRASGKGMPIDSVFGHIDDVAGLVAGAKRAKSLGFFGKSVIHPSQVGPVNDVFTPDRAARNWARQIVSSLGAAEVHRSGLLMVDDELLDPGLVQRARAIVRLVDRLESRDT